MSAHTRSMLFALPMILVPAFDAAPEAKSFAPRSEKTTLRRALAELSQQTGIGVEVGRDLPDRAIRLDRKPATFWQALDAIAAAGAARVRIYPTSSRIVLEKRGSASRLPPLSYDGRFRLSVRKVTTIRDLELRDDDPNRAVCILTIEAAWDPLLLPLYLETRPSKLRLTLDKNNARALADEGSSLAPVDGSIALPIEVRVPVLPPGMERIRALQGELAAIAPSKMLSFRFPSLAKLAGAGDDDPERRLLQDKIGCHIRKVTHEGKRWTVQVAVDCPAGIKQLDSNQSWVVNNEMILESTDGKTRLSSDGYALERSTPKLAILSYHFHDSKDLIRGGKASDWKVIYRTPANIIRMPIRFSFQDIPLR